jgi:hypothetical protein
VKSNPGTDRVIALYVVMTTRKRRARENLLAACRINTGAGFFFDEKASRCLAAIILRARRKGQDLFARRWADVPVPLRFLRPHELAVVIEDHPAVGVSHFQRERRRVVEVRQMVARERMPQRVIRPLCDASGCARRV